MAVSSYANISLLWGDQGGGKSTLGTALAIDDAHEHITGLMSPSGNEIVKASTLTKEDVRAFINAGMAPNKLKYARIYKGNESKIVKIPSDYIVLSSTKIFANYHIYGVKAVLMSMADVVEYMDTPLFNDSWILLDEGGGVKARQSMEGIGKLAADFYMTIRKRNARLVEMTQYARMMDVYLRLAGTTRINCSYDEDTFMITCEVSKRKEPTYTFEFYAPKYWKYFDTNDIIETPQYRKDRVLAEMHKVAVA